MKLALFSAEVQAHRESLLECILEGGSAWRIGFRPQRSDSDGSCVPSESAGCADVRFVQRLLKEDVDREVRAGHVLQHRDPGLLLQ